MREMQWQESEAVVSSVRDVSPPFAERERFQREFLQLRIPRLLHAKDDAELTLYASMIHIDFETLRLKRRKTHGNLRRVCATLGPFAETSTPLPAITRTDVVSVFD